MQYSVHVHSVMSNSLQSHDCNPSGSRLLCPWDFPNKNNGVVAPSPGDLPNPGIKPESSVSLTLAGRYFTAEPPGQSPQWKILSHKKE